MASNVLQLDNLSTPIHREPTYLQVVVPNRKGEVQQKGLFSYRPAAHLVKWHYSVASCPGLLQRNAQCGLFGDGMESQQS